MTPIGRRSVLIGGGLVAAGLAGNLLQPAAAADAVLAPGALDALIPDRVGAYRGVASDQLVLPNVDAKQRQSYSDVLMRHYVAPGAPMVMLVAAAGPRSGPVLGVHEPRLCYLSAGFSFTLQAMVPVPPPAPPGAVARTALALRADRSEVILYWIRIGNHFVTSPLEQRTTQIAANLRGVQPAARLMRLSMLVRSADEVETAIRLLAAFNRALMQRLSPTGRALVMGGAA
ncbi:exosortase C-terminal domain/associated protein EpsI [Sphingomonas sp. FW199]|uniref:exosortase C-terminal domain/associated protein EpsI n=1 Tax=Sphingomonas sp. FW199 TaxID=3400217 RepID=UPI003CFB4EFD